MGLDHQFTMRANSSPAAMAAAPAMASLACRPAGPGDALGPHQAQGAGLELAGDQRRPPEHPDQARDGEAGGPQYVARIEVALRGEGVSEHVRAVALLLADGDGGVVGVVELDPGHQQDDAGAH